MSSPFSVFRKHQKGLMAGMIIVAMVSFIVLGTVDQFMRRGPAERDHDTRLVATWDGGKITAGEVSRLIYNRIALNRFIYGLLEMAAKNAGRPAPQPFDMYSTNEREAVFASLLAEEARELGITVPDDQVMGRIKDFTNDTVSDSQLNTVLRGIAVGERPMTLSALVEALRTEMLAAEMQALYDGGARSFNYDATPAERWEYFCRINRRFKLQVYPIEVKDYITDPRIPEPTDRQLSDFYEAHKDNIPSASSPEPGFREPRAVKLEYIKADYVKFFDKAKAALTDEEIRKDFESRKESLRSSLESFEGMAPRDLLDALDEKAEAAKDPNAVRATEPDATPYEEATGVFAKRAPRATEPRFTDEEILSRERDSIVKRLAENKARDAMRKALDGVFQTMDRFYSVEYRKWLMANTPKDPQAKKEPPATPAPTFDLAKLAKPEEGLTYHQTSFLSAEDIFRDKALGNTFVNRRWGKSTDPTTKEVSVTQQDPGMALLNYVFTNKTKMSPFRAEDEIDSTAEGLYRNQYVFWKTDERAEQTPAFADIKDRVKTAWKIANNLTDAPDNTSNAPKSARAIARENAQKIADEINGNRVDGKVQTLKERFADSPEVKETEEITAYTTHELPAGFAQAASLHTQVPELTKLDEVEVGEDQFFREVLQLTDRQAGTAMNDSGSIVYVVQVFDAVNSTPEKLKEAFQRATFRMTQQQFRDIPSEQGYVLASRNDAYRRQQAWLAQFERDHGLKWEATPTE